MKSEPPSDRLSVPQLVTLVVMCAWVLLVGCVALLVYFGRLFSVLLVVIPAVLAGYLAWVSPARCGGRWYQLDLNGLIAMPVGAGALMAVLLFPIDDEFDAERHRFEVTIVDAANNTPIDGAAVEVQMDYSDLYAPLQTHQGGQVVFHLQARVIRSKSILRTSETLEKAEGFIRVSAAGYRTAIVPHSEWRHTTAAKGSNDLPVIRAKVQLLPD